MIKQATFSQDRKRRFDLIRDWRDEIGVPDKTALFVMLNPSKAGENEDDPTVRKVMGFARRWGFGRVVLVNLNPIVSTDPWELPPWNGIDIANKLFIERWMQDVDLVVCAWGSPPSAICRKIAMEELIYSFRQVVRTCLHCIGLTKGGFPLHPSRVAYTKHPQLWERR